MKGSILLDDGNCSDNTMWRHRAQPTVPFTSILLYFAQGERVAA